MLTGRGLPDLHAIEATGAADRRVRPA
jgi:hypothetical protein